MTRSTAIAALSGLLLIGGCAFWLQPPPIEDSRIVAAPPKLILDRAQRWFTSHRFEIEKDYRKRGGGRVVASQSPFRVAAYARCAWAFKMIGGVKPAARITVIAASQRGAQTRVTAKVDIALVNSIGDRAECSSHGILEQEILTAVATGP